MSTLSTLRNRSTLLVLTDYTTRTEQYHGREHLVVPVIALVQGVVHAMNASSAELVMAEEFSRSPGGWNGRPVFLGHPMRNGRPVSGNTPDVLQDEAIGTIFNTDVKRERLLMEAWIDVERAKRIAPTLLERIQAKESVEISVGVFVNADDAKGSYNGRAYAGAWHDIMPDHLAILPEDAEGACSFDMGCGVRANKRTTTTEEGSEVKNMYGDWLEPGADTDALLRTLRDIPQGERDKLSESDFAGPNRSFPIAAPEDVSAASSSLGRAKGDRMKIKAKIISIAYHKGDDYVAQLPDMWKRKSDQKVMQKGLLARLLSVFRDTQSPDEMTDGDLRRKLLDALKDKDPDCMWVDAWYPVDDPTHVVYTCMTPSTPATVTSGPSEVYGGGRTSTYERAFDLSASGVVTLNDAFIEVEPVMRYEPVEGAQPRMASSAEPKTTASGAPCSCHLKPTETRDMTKEQITKFLDTATDEQLKALSAVAEKKEPTAEEIKAAAAAKLKADEDVKLKAAEAAKMKAAEDKAAEDAKATTDAKATPKAPTFDELLATADPSTRAAINEGKRLGDAKRESTIKALKGTGRCKHTDEQLKALSQDELDNLMALADVKVVDFGGQGAVKDLSAAKEVPASQDLGEAIRAARAAKK
jgi:hypothetical protein